MQLHTLALAVLLAAPLAAQTLAAPFNTAYTLTSLGTVAGVPTFYAAIAFKITDPNVLLMAGGAGSATGAIYEVPLIRGAGGHITGFGAPVQVVTTPNIDGGMCYAPNLCLLYTTWPSNTLGQVLFGTTTVARTLALTTYGIGSSTGACNFVPAGYPGAGGFKIASYSTSTFYDVNLVPHASNDGTWDIAPGLTPVTITGNPEGFVYPPAGSPLIPDYTKMLICQWGTGIVGLWTIDATGNPVQASQVTFISGITGADGAAMDPITNDLLVSTYGGGNQIVVVSGFGSCGTCVNYGAGHPGTGSLVPTVTCGGCSQVGAPISVNVSNALPNALGALNMGTQQLNLQVFPGLFLLNNIAASVIHSADPSGSYTLNVTIPNSSIYAGFHVFWQAGYLDAGAMHGLSATAGIDQTIL